MVFAGITQAQAEVDLTGEPESEKKADAESGPGLVPGARFTLTQELAVHLKAPHDLTNNRTPFRVEYEKHFLDNFYVHVDAIETVFWENDHRSETRAVSHFGESTIRDTFIQFSKGNTSVKLGRQILIWGESEAGAITDVISPRDFSELFFISLEKSRISQFMLTVDQFSPVGDFGFFYVPRAKFNKVPERGDIYFVDPFGGTEETRTVDKKQHEFGLRWRKAFGGSDFSLMAAHLIDNERTLQQEGFTSDGRPVIVREPLRFNMIGGTFNVAGEGFLVSGEAAMKSPKQYFNPATAQTVEKDGIDTSLRVEYVLGKGGNNAVSLEAVTNHVMKWSEEILPVRRNTNSLVLGWRDSFLNDNLSVNWMTVYNATHRASRIRCSCPTSGATVSR